MTDLRCSDHAMTTNQENVVCVPCLRAENQRLLGILNLTVPCINSMVVKASDAFDWARNIQTGLKEEMEKAAKK